MAPPPGSTYAERHAHNHAHDRHTHNHPSPSNRLSLRDIAPLAVQAVEGMTWPPSIERFGETGGSGSAAANGNSVGSGAQHQRNRIDAGSKGSGNSKRHSVARLRADSSGGQAMLKRYDSMPLHRPEDESFRDNLRISLESLPMWAFVAAAAAAEAAILALTIAGMPGDSSSGGACSSGIVADDSGSYDDVCAPLHAAAAAVGAAMAAEVAARFYAWGLSHFCTWWNVLDAAVVAAGFPLTIVPYPPAIAAGAAALGCRLLFVGAALRRRAAVQRRRAATLAKAAAALVDGGDGSQAKAYEAPAVQLYQLLMRTIKSSCNVFDLEEKSKLRQLMYTLAHNQIYVDMDMQRGNAAYWKEYGFQRQMRRHSSVNAQDVAGVDVAALRGHRTSVRGGAAAALDGEAVIYSGHNRLADRAAAQAAVNSPTNRLLASDTRAFFASEGDELFLWLRKVDDWDFDAFELDEISGGHPLVALCNYLFDDHKYDFFRHFGLSKRHFTNYIIQIEAGYGPGEGKGVVNTYHNRRHAADVTQAVHYFMHECGLGASLTDIETIALVLSAIVHDFKHPGRSNAFLIKTHHELALVYNDTSVLENYHASEAFRVLRQDRCNFLRDVEPATVRSIRDLVIPLVVATDLKFHFDLLGEFNSHLSDIQNEIGEESKTRTYLSAMKMCIKSADISHPTRAMFLHLKWTAAVIEEFFLQGDEEKRRSLELSPNCDRDTTRIAESQKGFINFIIKPLFKSWVCFLGCPAANTCMNNLEVNEAMWVEKGRTGDDTLDALVPKPVDSHRASVAGLPPGLATAASAATAVQKVLDAGASGGGAEGSPRSGQTSMAASPSWGDAASRRSGGSGAGDEDGAATHYGAASRRRDVAIDAAAPKVASLEARWSGGSSTGGIVLELQGAAAAAATAAIDEGVPDERV